MRVLRELSEVDGLMLSSGRRSNNQGGRTYLPMVYTTRSASSSSFFLWHDESDHVRRERRRLLRRRFNCDYEDEPAVRRTLDYLRLLVKCVRDFGVPETVFDEDSYEVLRGDEFVCPK